MNYGLSSIDDIMFKHNIYALTCFSSSQPWAISIHVAMSSVCTFLFLDVQIWWGPGVPSPPSSPLRPWPSRTSAMCRSWTCCSSVLPRRLPLVQVTILLGELCGCLTKADWWFGTFFIFPYVGDNHPNWLIFFRGVQTTNEKESGMVSSCLYG